MTNLAVTQTQTETNQKIQVPFDLNKIPKNASRKIIFLDVDGVLNNQNSPATILYKNHKYVGIDDDKMERLKTIVQMTNAEIILTSTWAKGWEKDNKEKQDVFGNTLDVMFAKYGLSITDKTENMGFRRGQSILNYLKEPTRFVILDDEPFDYDVLGISNFWVQTQFFHPNGGLQDEHITEAVTILSE